MNSRWLETPAHVTEREGDLPAGFRMSGVACGLKPSGGLDLALIVADASTDYQKSKCGDLREGRSASGQGVSDRTPSPPSGFGPPTAIRSRLR